MSQNNKNSEIKDVWDDNFEEEIQKISELIETYNYIGMVNIYKFYKKIRTQNTRVLS
jgi:hypothetical protein